ncbi:MAG: hypothetical protein JO206_13825, partial [Solirubrobacterales bacterium]|nr:hypothetical protein [Solirubrobacterales bacterium]
MFHSLPAARPAVGSMLARGRSASQRLPKGPLRAVEGEFELTGRGVAVLDADPDLASGLEPDDQQQARRR